MAMIADTADVSAPTVFNYFGSKDNLLNSLIFEEARKTRKRWAELPVDKDAPLAQSLTRFLGEVSENTIKIAAKRVWRYAESSIIRRPNTEFEQKFTELDDEMIAALARFLAARDLKMRAGTLPDPTFLARMFFDRWTAHYLLFIKQDTLSLARHIKDLRADIDLMCALLFIDNPQTATA